VSAGRPDRFDYAYWIEPRLTICMAQERRKAGIVEVAKLSTAQRPRWITMASSFGIRQ
jgi:hypothetical protein